MTCRYVMDAKLAWSGCSASHRQNH